MYNLNYYNPTRIVIAENSLYQLPDFIPSDTRIMLISGQESAIRNGTIETVTNILKQHKYDIFEYSGISSNPDLNQLLKVIAAARQDKIDYLLAIGGGSVIDATKFIATFYYAEDFDILAAPYESEAFTEQLKQTIFTPSAPNFPQKHLPFGVISTCPGTGSETNRWTVISDHQRKIKVDFGHNGQYPQFALFDPSITLSIPETQLRYSICDAFIHVLEQYLLIPEAVVDCSPLQAEFCESILRTIKDYGLAILANPTNLEYRSKFIWAASLALNGLISAELHEEDWSTHQLGHTLTALYQIPHAPSLTTTILANLYLRRHAKQERLERLARQVFKCEVSANQEANIVALQALAKFFKQLGMPLTLEQALLPTGQEIAKQVITQLEQQKIQGWGEQASVNAKLVEQILTLKLPSDILEY